MNTDSRQLRRITLNDGNTIPVIAFGTGTSLFEQISSLGTSLAWKSTTKIVFAALSSGLTSVDCAWHYKNQQFTGQALRQSGIKREEIYISSKGGSFDDPPEDFDARAFLMENLSDVSEKNLETS